jgi:hypothetical protein
MLWIAAALSTPPNMMRLTGAGALPAISPSLSAAGPMEAACDMR